MMSANPVQAADGGRENGSPDFVDEKVDRGVAETADVGDDVGLPVTASVESTNRKDTLTYGLRAVWRVDLTSITGVDLPSGTGTEPVDDLAAFDIDKATGQITVAQKLDFESRGESGRREIRRGRHGHGPHRLVRRSRSGHHGRRQERSPGVEGTAGADYQRD